jgi:DNA-binding NtrC family response regulator
LAVSSALARSRERELKAVARADRVDDECKRLEHIIFAASGRHLEQAERLARSVRTTAYSPAARQALERLERLGKQGAPISLLAPPGVEAIGWAAHAHLESGRAGGAFVIVDGSNPTEHPRELWEDKERSPLVLADGGTLTILDVAVLPLEIQDYIAEWFARRRNSPIVSSVAKPGLFVTLRVPLTRLLDEQRLSRDLSRWLGASEVLLPTLAERPEDLQALALEALSRVGLSLRGEPLGLEPAALRLLAEHDWPGNELEFRARLLSAARRAPGAAVRADDLLATGFAPAAPITLDLSPPPPLVVRRPRPRRAPRGR